MVRTALTVWAPEPVRPDERTPVNQADLGSWVQRPGPPGRHGRGCWVVVEHDKADAVTTRRFQQGRPEGAVGCVVVGKNPQAGTVVYADLQAVGRIPGVRFRASGGEDQGS